jgi:hypothetical protein
MSKAQNGCRAGGAYAERALHGGGVGDSWASLRFDERAQPNLTR